MVLVLHVVMSFSIQLVPVIIGYVGLRLSVYEPACRDVL